MLIRSIIFYFLLFVWTLFLGIISLPTLLLPIKNVKKLANLWINGILGFRTKTTNGLMELINGLMKYYQWNNEIDNELMKYH